MKFEALVAPSATQIRPALHKYCIFAVWGREELPPNLASPSAQVGAWWPTPGWASGDEEVSNELVI